MTLMSLGYDTKYIDFMVNKMELSLIDKEVLILYSFVFVLISWEKEE